MTDRDLWHAIYALYEMLIDRENDENAYQSLFDAHPAIFVALGFDSYQSYERSSGKKLPFDPDRGFRPEPDFLCAEIENSTVTVFELKTPFVPRLIIERGDGNRQKLSATAESYVSQATEYAESIRERSDAREIVKADLGLSQISAIKIALAYAIASDNDLPAVSRLLSQRKIPTSIVYFDSLLDKLIQSYVHPRPNTEGRPGLMVVYHMVIDRDQPADRAFIVDHGVGTKNRLSIYVENNELVYRCIDNESHEHQLRATIEYGRPVFVRFEFANDDDGFYLSLNVDNEERDFRVGGANFNFAPQVHGLVIGTDNTRQYFSRFNMLEMYYATETMSVKDKLGSYHYFKRRISESRKSVRFDGTHFMIRDTDGNLKQSKSEFQPKYEDWKTPGEGDKIDV